MEHADTSRSTHPKRIAVVFFIKRPLIFCYAFKIPFFKKGKPGVTFELVINNPYFRKKPEKQGPGCSGDSLSGSSAFHARKKLFF